jgi:hypothetical protein
LIEFLYTGRLFVNSDLIESLLNLSEKYKVKKKLKKKKKNVKIKKKKKIKKKNKKKVKKKKKKKKKKIKELKEVCYESLKDSLSIEKINELIKNNKKEKNKNKEIIKKCSTIIENNSDYFFLKNSDYINFDIELILYFIDSNNICLNEVPIKY